MKIVYTPGVWDLFHVGHLNLLLKAKELGNYLVVGIQSDISVEKQKDKAPAISEENRVKILNALQCVDEVFIYEDTDQSNVLQIFKVDIFAVGPEFGNCEKHQTTIQFCESNSLPIVVISRTDGISTTEIKSSIKS